MVGLAIVAFVVICAIFAPLIAPHDPGEQDLLHILLPPAWTAGGDPSFPLGTDSLGRDVLSRLLYGARTAMAVAVLAALGAMIIGAILAHISGYFGGIVDWIIARIVDVWMSFPPVILSLVLMVGLGIGVDKVIFAIILVDWTRFCRVLRSEVLVVKQRDYVAAARLIGFTHWQTIAREVLPATLPLLITLLSLEMGIAVVCRSHSIVHRARRRPQPAGLGPNDRRRPPAHLRFRRRHLLSDRRDLCHRHRIQSARRWTTPGLRRPPADGRPAMTPTLRVRNLKSAPGSAESTCR